MITPAYRCAALAVATITVFLSGCGGQPPASGTVTFNDEPVNGGVIVFSSEATPDKKATGKIVDGKFTIPAGSGLTVGKNKVEIFWNKKTGKQVPVTGDAGTTTDETVQVIPNTFNTNSTLSEEVKSGENTFTFNLKGTPNPPQKPGTSKDPVRVRD